MTARVIWKRLRSKETVMMVLTTTSGKSRTLTRSRNRLLNRRNLGKKREGKNCVEIIEQIRG